MVAPNENLQPMPDDTKVPLKVVKAIPTSPITAQFDIIELEGKQVVVGALGFVDQFGMERMAKTSSEQGILNIGKQVLAIFGGAVDITEPDEETKAKLADQMSSELAKQKIEVFNAYNQKK